MRSISGLFAATLLFCFISPAHAQNDLTDIPDPDPELERQSFIVAEGFEVNLFASDPEIAKPVQINFDSAGRLWVASSSLYPQIKPGQEAGDKVIVLEDADGDGRAEKSTVFAEGLLIPTGIEPGDGGVYVSNSTELLHLRDTDGDGRADERRIVLSGFGTEDTHHILHTLRWGPAVALYMNQSIYIHSHVETPYGVRRLDGGGIWRFRPETMQLDVFARGFVNAWGHAFDRWGQSFATDGAYGEGINYVFPGSVFVAAPGATRILKGLNPGSPKHCGLEVVDGRHLPNEWQGNMITNDFRAHRVCRFVVTESGSGYASKEMPELIKTNHVAFRPVDVKMGPDGAIYIADWYNPIIQHGEVDFRDPRRDHVHGRIWRVTAKGRPLVPRPNLIRASTKELIAQLAAPETWTREHAKRLLRERGSGAVASVLQEWLAGLDPADAAYEHRRLEALWTYQALGLVEQELLRAVLRSPDHRARAAATRVLSHWLAHLPDAVQLLAVQVADDHPRVRLEAVTALANIRTLEAAQLAARALDRPMDENLDFALWTTLRELAGVWLPAVQAGEFDFGGQTDHLIYALEAIGSPEVVKPLLELVRKGKIPPERAESVLVLVARLGGPEELGGVLDRVVNETAAPAERRVQLIQALTEAAQKRNVRPAGDLAPRLKQLISDKSEPVVVAALRLLGALEVAELRDRLLIIISSETYSASVRQVAIEALGRLGEAGDPHTLATVASLGTYPYELRQAAVAALTGLDLNQAASRAVKLLKSPEERDPAPLVRAFLERQNGAAALAGALANQTLPSDTAKLAVRAVQSFARREPALVEALNRAGGLGEPAAAMSPQEIEEILTMAKSSGDPGRGERLFRRSELTCLKCHAVGGAGGQVGPDLSSIGASAQIDYLLESLIDPSKKIKENYHSLVVVTEDGRVVSGVKIRETTSELILRDAEDREVVVPLESIDEQQDGASLMPAGLVDSLTRSELADLVRFLAELGKLGDYSVGRAPVVRRWRVLESTPEVADRLRQHGVAAVAEAGDELAWQPNYSTVSGRLPLDELPVLEQGQAGPSLAIVRFEIEAAAPGPAVLKFDDPGGLRLWHGAEEIHLAPETRIELAQGRNVFTLAVRREERGPSLRIELQETAGSPAAPQLVGGK